MSSQNDDPSKYPALGRWMTWVDKPGSAMLIVKALAAVCVLLFVLNFFYDPHAKFGVENIYGFYGFYGFIMFTLLILAAKTLRMFIKRREDFYGRKAVDREDYPEHQLERRDHV